MDEVDVSFFIVAADVVGLAGGAFSNDRQEGSAMVFDVQPVADVFAFAVNGNGLAAKAFEDDDWDQLFGELVGPVVVAAVGDHDGQAVGVLPGSGEVVGGRFAGGVGRVGIVGCGFGEEAFVAEAAVDFVGGDVEEAEAIFGITFERSVVLEAGLQQVEGADDVGLDELARTVDAAIDVTLGSQVHNGIWLVVGDGLVDGGRVGDVDLGEAVTGIGFDVDEGREVAGVGQGVDVEDLVTVGESHADEVAADEARAAGDEKAAGS